MPFRPDQHIWNVILGVSENWESVEELIGIMKKRKVNKEKALSWIEIEQKVETFTVSDGWQHPLPLNLRVTRGGGRIGSRGGASVSITSEQSTEGGGGLDIWLGRGAMVGFAVAISVEIATGKGLLEFWFGVSECRRPFLPLFTFSA
ncbi:hypothetical protein Rs2_07574 [Raphanus sativus]|nr:hypothetical protein Rs2_07574 [Raphanus sativus]